MSVETAPSHNGKTSEMDQAVKITGERLLEQCSKVRVRINWFGMTAKVDDEIAQEMLDTIHAGLDSATISKRLLKSKHTALDAAKQARQAISDHVKSMTIPLLALREGISDPKMALRKDAGIRLIQKKDMAAFDERIQYLIGILNTAVKDLQKAMPDIKTEDRERLGLKLYSDKDYPEDVTKMVSVEVSYEPVGVDVDWEKLCPEIYKREQLSARKKFEAVVENAAVEFADRFVKYVRQVCDQLGNRTRLNPKANGPWAKLSDAEVVEKVTNAEDEDIQPGYVLLCVRYAKEGKKGRKDMEWLEEPIAEAVYRDELRPFETSERKKLYASTVDNLKAELETFINIGSMLGPYADVIKDGVAKVKEMLTESSQNLDAEKIASQLRDESYFRKEMKSALAKVADEVQSAVGTVKQVRRRISVKAMMIGKDDD